MDNPLDIYFHTYEDTGEVSYQHPYTHKTVFLEDDQTIQSVLEGWSDHLADVADDAWHNRSED